MEIISFAIFGLLIVISPGADFVLVFQNSLGRGRKAGLFTALGVGVGVCVHVTYSILGISHLISQNIFLFSIVKYAGSAYLIYLGMMELLRSKLKLVQKEVEHEKGSVVGCFTQGFFCNLLNPKTMLFFLSVFSQLISSENDNMSFVLMYGLYIALLHGAWFCLMAVVVTSERVSVLFERFSRRISQVCGAGLITFGALLSLNT
jgi:RhtB (resistance to homoserine/threonine) family protein